MKRSLFFYYLSLITSVILAVFSIVVADSHASVYDAVSAPTTISSEILENKSYESPKIADSFARTPVFSTASVVKPTVPTFSAPVIGVQDMNYTDYNGINHLNDYAIMHYGVSGNNFYYAHNTGGFASLADLSVGTDFIVGGIRYRVMRKDILTFADTASAMRSIISSAGHAYSASFMTCYGSMGYYQNNSGRVEYTASHRVVIYADRV